MSGTKTILITGATGRQGGAIARALASTGFELHCMTRKPDSPAARELARLGLRIVQADLDDAASLRRVLARKWGVFAVQTREGGVLHEEQQGKRLAELAQEAGVAHFVYSSVQSANRNTGIPHFESKWRIEELVRSLRFPSYVILRPVFFMENLVSPEFLHGDTLMSPLQPDTPLQMIAVRDIGHYGALAFAYHERLNGRELELAGDHVSMERAVLALSEGREQLLDYVQIPLKQVRKQSKDLALLYAWLEQVGYSADIRGLAREFGYRATRLYEWARSEGQRGRGAEGRQRPPEWGLERRGRGVFRRTRRRDRVREGQTG
jgi:uncharacterized protein YbjT (DUF2867 family)